MRVPQRSRSLTFELLDERRLLAATPIRVGDINTTPVPWSSSYPHSLTEMNGVLYYAADDGITGSELWRSDGTEQGTYQVKDIAAGAPGSGPAELTNVNGVLYFVANRSSFSHELWKSDGTESGTVLVKSVSIDEPESSAESFDFSDLKKIGDRLFFVVNRPLTRSFGKATARLPEPAWSPTCAAAQPKLADDFISSASTATCGRSAMLRRRLRQK
jgi:ELWxxDGT repeat protein